MKSLLRDSFIYTLAKIIPGIAGFASVIILFRLIGAQEYGQYSFMFAYCNMIAALCFGWLNQSLLRYYGVFSIRSKSFKETVFFATIVLVVVSSALIFILHWLNISKQTSIFLSIVCTISIASFGLVKTYLQAKLKSNRVLWITLVQSVLAISISISLVLFIRPSHSMVIIGIMLAYLITTLSLLKKNTFVLTSKNRGQLIKRVKENFFMFFKFGWPLSFYYVIGLALPFFDRYFIKHFLSLEQLGIYASFQELLTKIFSLILFPVTMAVHPKIMNLWNEKNYRTSIYVIGLGLIIQFFIFLLFAVPVFLFTPSIFNFISQLMPNLNHEHKDLLIPLFTTGFIWQISLMIHKPLELKERTHLMFIFILLSLIINVIGNILFIPEYGIIATAYTALISSTIYLLLVSFASYPILRQTLKSI